MFSRIVFSKRSWKLQQQQNYLLLVSWFSNSTSSSSSSSSALLAPPIRVSFTENAGRGIFATRNITAGDLIHTAKPLLSHPSLSLLHKVCYLCLKKLKMGTSSSSWDQHITSTSRSFEFDISIGDISFCSEECRRSSEVFFEVEKSVDWLAFDDHCRLQGLKYPSLAKRLACMVISGATTEDSLDILQPAKSGCQMEEEFELLKRSFMKAGFNDAQLKFLNKQWYVGVLARIRINAFRIELAGGLFDYEDLLSLAAASVSAEVSVGNVVYILPSFYNHDCDPNAHIIWVDSADARLKALRNIEAGEELRICYIDASMDREARQTLLYQGFGFQCQCLRCSSGD